MNHFVELGLVKNQTGVPQQVGTYTVPPHAIGRVPASFIESLRQHPMRELLVVEDHPDLCPWVRTEREPDGPRYR